MRGLRAGRGRGARRGGRRPGAAARRGAGAGRGERQRQVHPGLRDHQAAAATGRHHRGLGALRLVGQPPYRRAARAPGAALERDRGGAAELDERPQPGTVHRHPVFRRAARAPAGHEPGRPAGPVGPAARDGGHSRRPAEQLPARAVRRHAAAGDDRHRARARPVGGDHGRADHRARRGDPARDPRGAHDAARPAGFRRAVHLPRPVTAGRDRRFDRGHVRGPAGGTGRRQRDLPGAAAPVLARPAELVPRPARAAPGHGRHPRIAPRPAEHAAGVHVPPALRVRVRPVPQRPAAAAARPGRGHPGGRVLAAGRARGRAGRAGPPGRNSPRGRNRRRHRSRRHRGRRHRSRRHRGRRRHRSRRHRGRRHRSRRHRGRRFGSMGGRS